MQLLSVGTRLFCRTCVAMLRFCSGAAIFLLGLVAPAVGTTNTWSATGNLTTARSGQTATLLPNGKVLVLGGTSAELYDPSTGTWSVTGSTNVGHSGHTATLLPNGTVLVAGGINTAPLDSAELYDPIAGTWSTTGSMAGAGLGGRYSHTATLLPNGKVLAAGGVRPLENALDAQIYNPASGTWGNAGNLVTYRCAHTATLLPNGKVLLAGGVTNSGNVTSSAELYDPVAGSFSATGFMSIPRATHTTTLLANGTVLAVGGTFVSPSTSADLYDSAAGALSATGSQAFDFGDGATLYGRTLHSATLLPSGKVLAAGGIGGISPDCCGFFSGAQLYDPAAGTWSVTGTMGSGRVLHSATLLPTGTVLVAGGIDSGGNFAAER